MKTKKVVSLAQITQETCDLSQKLGLKNLNLGLFLTMLPRKDLLFALFRGHNCSIF